MRISRLEFFGLNLFVYYLDEDLVRSVEGKICEVNDYWYYVSF